MSNIIDLFPPSDNAVEDGPFTRLLIKVQNQDATHEETLDLIYWLLSVVDTGEDDEEDYEY